MTPNAELAYRVLDHLTANPHQYDPIVASGWYDADGYATDENDGTLIGDFEAWACLLSGDRNLEDFDDGNGYYGVITADGVAVDMEKRAVELLGLTPDVNDWVLATEEGDTLADLAAAVAEVFGPRPEGLS